MEQNVLCSPSPESGAQTYLCSSALPVTVLTALSLLLSCLIRQQILIIEQTRIASHRVISDVMMLSLSGKTLLLHAAFDLSTPHSCHPLFALWLILSHAAAFSTLTNWLFQTVSRLSVPLPLLTFSPPPFTFIFLQVSQVSLKIFCQTMI